MEGVDPLQGAQEPLGQAALLMLLEAFRIVR